MTIKSKLTKAFRASSMRARMQVSVCRDGMRRNALLPLTVPQQIDAFWKKVKKGADNECWMWLGATCGSNSKYGHALFGGTLKKAHRIAYEITFGEIPKGMLACHKCDNSLCVNPNHIFIGTYRDNILDMIKKGRQVKATMRGEESPRCKITEAQVIKAKFLRRTQGLMYKEIAKATGISRTNVSSILEGRSWRHVP